ncbi:hypothetical protein KD146_13470 [Devosia sp. BSSL-BM10]|uniref:Uncharacterized protein n=1 Tax=Devosia litorisediminis TaxID=2829817 RepID=A0A942E7W0_9HYPH|nr:hypothetical protein [Devosia litorisediminis]MBS3849708.1 hypothetical protein [Devosia litorisediminis]
MQTPALKSEVSELARMTALLAQLPDYKRRWFHEQVILASEGQPSAIDGTGPLPDWWRNEVDGEAGHAV